MPKYAELPAFREQNFITEADGDMLHRDARALAIRRIEESARTEADFENVLYWWDKLDANRERKERDHETGRSAVPLEWGAYELYLSDSPSYDMILRRLMLAGNFLDIIFDHPETIHELVTDEDLSKIFYSKTMNLSELVTLADSKIFEFYEIKTLIGEEVKELILEY